MHGEGQATLDAVEHYIFVDTLEYQQWQDARKALGEAAAPELPLNGCDPGDGSWIWDAWWILMDIYHIYVFL